MAALHAPGTRVAGVMDIHACMGWPNFIVIHQPWSGDSFWKCAVDGRLGKYFTLCEVSAVTVVTFSPSYYKVGLPRCDIIYIVRTFALQMTVRIS